MFDASLLKLKWIIKQGGLRLRRKNRKRLRFKKRLRSRRRNRLRKRLMMDYWRMEWRRMMNGTRLMRK